LSNKTIITITSQNIEPLFDKDRAGDVKHSLASIEKIKNELDYNVVADFKEGLEKTVEFYE
jgi:nucleoside-diphosphate-sugar epimerase